ncbi:MAG TPA: flagellar hook-associated protein FlgK [Gemmatimonadales bacterium]|jgi:flagellar hook-associated protein 1 FlgK|nr:flagellar hook-associated protein FlgK [Gemmatimonadales bacterium]
MAGLVDLLSIARSALMTQQRALNTTGTNIANASTPGYVRQTLNLTEAVPQNTPNGPLGRGVTDTGVTAQRDVFLDASYREEQGTYNAANTLSGMVSQVQTLFNEPTSGGLGASIDTLIGAFGDLANDPSNGAVRNTVQADAQQVIQQFHSLDDGLNDTVGNARQQFSADVDQVNQIATQVAELNKQIVAQRAGGHDAPDLETQRGVLLDQLSTLGDTRVLDRTDGSVGVVFGDTMLVDSGTAQQFSASASGSGMVATVVGDTRTVQISSGSLAGLENIMTTAIPDVRAGLNQLSAALVSAVNTLHETGTTPGGATGTDFFDPAGTTAATIALSSTVAASPSNIAAGASSASGDGSIALALSQLGTATNASLGGISIPNFYDSVVTKLATTVQNAQDDASAAQTISAGLSAQRSSETGVSTDEEMIALITQQQAYTAAAHVVTVANDLMTDVLNMVQ